MKITIQYNNGYFDRRACFMLKHTAYGRFVMIFLFLVMIISGITIGVDLFIDDEIEPNVFIILIIILIMSIFDYFTLLLCRKGKMPIYMHKFENYIYNRNFNENVNKKTYVLFKDDMFEYIWLGSIRKQKYKKTFRVVISESVILINLLYIERDSITDEEFWNVIDILTEKVPKKIVFME